MGKNNHSFPKTSFWQKAALSFFGFFLSICILEIGLRVGGFVMLASQEHRNLQSIKQKGTYRIMCLGESTTFGGLTKDSYPAQLEEVLNHRNLGIRFYVINKGIPAKNTTFILRQLENYLNSYKPDMVVAMMGINDGMGYLPYEERSSLRATHPLSAFRVYKLFRLLWLHIVHKIKERDFDAPKECKINSALNTQAINKSPGASNDGSIDINKGPKNFQMQRGKHDRSEVLIKEGIKQNSENGQTYQAYMELGSSFYDRREFDQAEALFKKAIAMDPMNYKGYVELGDTFLWLKKFSQAEEAFNKAVGLNPRDTSILTRWGWMTSSTQGPQQAEKILRRAIEVNPKDSLTCYTVGQFFHKEGKYVQAREMYEEAIKANSKFDPAYGGLAAMYAEMGNSVLAKEFYQKANEIRLKHYNSDTSSNYKELKKILDDRGIMLVCVQYPVRSLEPLRKIFAGQGNIIFVDNEKVFKDALSKASHKEYFTDMFGGDFGHCTPKGKRLLAENIASVILKEVFGK